MREDILELKGVSSFNKLFLQNKLHITMDMVHQNEKFCHSIYVTVPEIAISPIFCSVISILLTLTLISKGH